MLPCNNKLISQRLNFHVFNFKPAEWSCLVHTYLAAPLALIFKKWQVDENRIRQGTLDEDDTEERGDICVYVWIISAIIAFSLVHVEHVSSCCSWFIKPSIIVLHVITQFVAHIKFQNEAAAKIDAHYILMATISFFKYQGWNPVLNIASIVSVLSTVSCIHTVMVQLCAGCLQKEKLAAKLKANHVSMQLWCCLSYHCIIFEEVKAS